jgi:threonine/homoserine/homoserine lactone efflux protein
MRRSAGWLAAIPVVALTFAVPFVNRDDPHVLGMPFVLAWILFWIALTPLFLWVVHRAMNRDS